MPRPASPDTYGSLAWCKNELSRLRKLRRLLETECMGLRARCQMLTEYVQSQGIPLDEAEMRAAHTQEIIDRIHREHRLRVLEDFYGDIAAIIHRANEMQATSHDPARAALINSLEAVCRRRRRRMQLPFIDAAREEAERQVARIPSEVAHA